MTPLQVTYSCPLADARPFPRRYRVECLDFDGGAAHCDREPGHRGDHGEDTPTGRVTWRNRGAA